MKKRYFVLILIIFFGFIFWALLRGVDAPTAPRPTPDATLTPEAPAAQKDDLIVVDTPRAGSQVASPLIVKGRARGNWYFEGSFPITLTDWDGKIIAEGYATAQGEWMTTEYVPFTASIKYELPPETPYRRGFLILHKDNPSDDPALDNSLELQVNL